MSPHGSFTDTPWMISLAIRGTASASRGAAAIINSLERIPRAAAAGAAAAGASAPSSQPPSDRGQKNP